MQFLGLLIAGVGRLRGGAGEFLGVVQIVGLSLLELLLDLLTYLLQLGQLGLGLVGKLGAGAQRRADLEEYKGQGRKSQRQESRDGRGPLRAEVLVHVRGKEGEGEPE